MRFCRISGFQTQNAKADFILRLELCVGKVQAAISIQYKTEFIFSLITHK